MPLGQELSNERLDELHQCIAGCNLTRMARAGIVLSVLISSPSDVAPECATILTAIRDWNSSHSSDTGIVLEPVQWQTHAYPESGDRPQALINKQIVDESDMVIAVFGHRIGTTTGAAQSGTIEEIERLRAKGKHVAVYFSDAPVPRDHDPDQLRLLNEYRQSLKSNTLYWIFENSEALYRLISQHLAKSVQRLHQELMASGTIRLLASQLPSAVRGAEMTAEATVERKPSAEPFKMQHVFIGQFPDGPKLRLTATRRFAVSQVECLDESGARVSSEALSLINASRLTNGKGQQLEIPIDHAKLIQIHNLKPRTGSAAIPMQFRLHLALDGSEEIRTIPTLLQPGFKNIGNTSTYFMDIIG